MKISIWQQFSSNHSASFEIVGEFQTSELAKEAANKVKSILSEIQAWYTQRNEYPENSSRANQPPTPIEKKYGEQYEFDWKQTLDWARYRLDGVVDTYDRLVVIDSIPVDTWQTGHQIENLLNGMGANVARKVMEGRDPDNMRSEVWMAFRFKIECYAENDNVARDIVAHFQPIFEKMSDYKRESTIPWIAYHPDLVASDKSKEKILQLETIYLKGLSIIEHIQKMFHNLGGEKFKEKWQENLNITHEEWVEFGAKRRNLRVNANVSFSSNKLFFADVSFSNIVNGLPAFLSYLEELDCTNIKYTVYQL